jgi:uncharacterized protein
MKAPINNSLKEDDTLGLGTMLIDTDIHHAVKADSDLFPYLDSVNRERLKYFGGTGAAFHWFNNGGEQGHRTDLPKEYLNGAAVCDVDGLIKNHLDIYNIDYGLLTGLSVYGASVWPDVDYGAALCSAFNDYTIEHWLKKDDRLRLAIAICTQDPASAVREIERLEDHPQVVGVLMPTGASKPFGNRFYDPIYSACQERGLVPTLHLGTEGLATVGPPTAAGWPSYYVESRLARPSVYQAHLASFIFHGTFEKFPKLQVAILECGIGWIPSFIWQMDSDWKALRYQTPWVKRSPSEYVREYVRFNSQPLVEPPSPGPINDILKWMHAEETLMFGSDFPHFDFDEPGPTFKRLEPELRQRILSGNAYDTFDFKKYTKSLG